MLESALTALQALVQPQQLILLLVGVLAGLVIGLDSRVSAAQVRSRSSCR